MKCTRKGCNADVPEYESYPTNLGYCGQMCLAVYRAGDSVRRARPRRQEHASLITREIELFEVIELAWSLITDSRASRLSTPGGHTPTPSVRPRRIAPSRSCTGLEVDQSTHDTTNGVHGVPG